MGSRGRRTSSGNKLRNAQKLGDVLHPDLKHSKLSAREILEESLAATPREFTAEPVEELDDAAAAEETLRPAFEELEVVAVPHV